MHLLSLNLRNSCTPRRFSWPALFFFGSLLRGQELRPATADGGDAHNAVQSDGADPSGHEFHYGPIGGHLTFNSSLVYDDNINIQPDHKVADLIWKFSPEILLGTGDYLQQQDSWLTFDYAPTFLVFARNSHYDAIDQDVRLHFEWKPANWTFGVKQEYLRLSEALIEVGSRVDRSTYNTNLYSRYDYSPKTAFEADANQSINDYPDSLFSYNEWTAAAWMDYWATPKFRVGIGALGGVLSISENPGQHYEQALMRAEYDMKQNVQFQGIVGGERRQFEGNLPGRWNYTFSFAATFEIEAHTELALSAYRRDENSLIAAGQNYTVTGASTSTRSA
jgi:hypothetical protein